MQTEKSNVYDRITTRIIADLEQGVRPWLKPWSNGHLEGQINRPRRACGTPYSGINTLVLWGEAMDKGFCADTWMTYKQAQALGANVRKGERGSQVVFASKITRTETDKTGDEVVKQIPFLKSYAVFNVEQVDGLPARFYAAPEPKPTDFERHQRADEFFAATGAHIGHGGTRAFYAKDRDHVQMPPIEAFHTVEGYYATLAHEMTHWTRHPSRLAREFGRKRWGDAGYAAEELVAELGAAFLCADLDLTPTLREDHASYIASWLTVLKNDNRAIFTAASYAQRAADYLHSLQARPIAEAA